MPRIVFFEHQVDPLNTMGALTQNERVYVEIQMKDGIKLAGSLVRITRDDLIITHGSSDQNGRDILQEILIPKTDVMIMKVW